MDLGLLQWPAMAVTVAASYLVGSEQPLRRTIGFWLFMASNALWVAWGLYDEAPALIALQFCLAALNVRGAWKANKAKKAKDAGQEKPGASTVKAAA